MSQQGGPVGTGEYVVSQGECMESIAFKTGHFWEYLWNHADNSAVNSARKNPNVLLEGDRVAVPPLRKGSESCGTEQLHRFRRKGVPSRLRVQVLCGSKVRVNEPYRLVLDGKVLDGTTDGEGWIDIPIPPDAAGGRLVVGSEPVGTQTYELELGGMDPVTEAIGIQKRLKNLGIACEETGELDEQTRAAVAEFQTQSGQEASGEPDQAFQDRLVEEHGS